MFFILRKIALREKLDWNSMFVCFFEATLVALFVKMTIPKTDHQPACFRGTEQRAAEWVAEVKKTANGC